MQMNDALAARIADVPHDGAVGDRDSTLEANGRPVEVSVKDDVVAKAAALAKAVLGDHARAEQLSDEEQRGVALLMLQRDGVYLRSPRRREVDATVPDVRELAAVALLALGQVEIVAAHRQLGSRRNRVPVRFVLDRPVRTARDLLVRLKASALVVVRAGQRGQLVTA